jgi:hypothetical protein
MHQSASRADISHASAISALQTVRRTIESTHPAPVAVAPQVPADVQRDAERYRWLRARLPGSAYRIAGVIYSEGGAGVDAAIDAAMLSASRRPTKGGV